LYEDKASEDIKVKEIQKEGKLKEEEDVTFYPNINHVIEKCYFKHDFTYDSSERNEHTRNNIVTNN